MKAIVITKFGAPGVLQVQERPVPSPKENELLIHVKAAGVNRPDVSQRKGNYPHLQMLRKIFPVLKLPASLNRAALQLLNGNKVIKFAHWFPEVVMLNMR